MRVAIVHYHLRSAGVTRVIQSAVKTLKERGHAPLVFSAEPPTAKLAPDCPVAILEGLAYDTSPRQHPPRKMAKALDAQCREHLGGPADLVHIHNHSLGKNLTLPLLARHLAGEAMPLVLQPHDFAEDGRPANYGLLKKGLAEEGLALDAGLYPLTGKLAYAVLNQRDGAILQAAGLPEERLFLLPNGVSDFSPLPPAHEERFLYPTTAIRRKNLGEFLLMAVAEPGKIFAVTQSPSNPSARPLYEQWKDWAESKKLPVTFDFGQTFSSFEETLAQGHCAISTSIAEGFGLAFLEPWLMNRPLKGRRLPAITADFSAQGIALDHLYDALPVPPKWLQKEAINERLRPLYQKYLEQYGHPFTEDLWQALQENFWSGEGPDFGRLDEQAQREILDQTLDSDEKKAWWRKQFRLDAPGPDIEENAARVRRHYSLEAYGEKLETLYQAVLETPPLSQGALSSDAVLEAFLAPKNFNCLRS